MVVTETIAGLGALKTAFDMSKALKDINDAVIRNAAVIELQEKILAAREAQTTLLERISELEKEVAAFETQRSQLERYQLKDFGGNTFAYELKASEANGEPIHRACPTCYQNGHISVLQFCHNVSNQDWYDCLVCSSHRPYGHAVRREISRDRGGEYF